MNFSLALAALFALLMCLDASHAQKRSQRDPRGPRGPGEAFFNLHPGKPKPRAPLTGPSPTRGGTVIPTVFGAKKLHQGEPRGKGKGRAKVQGAGKSKKSQVSVLGPQGPLQCYCRPAGPGWIRQMRRKLAKKGGIPKMLQGFCNKIAYVNNQPSFTYPETRLLPYTKPKFNAIARKTDDGGAVIERNGPSKNLPSGSLQKYGFQTTKAVAIPVKARVARFYTQVRFRTKPASSPAPGSRQLPPCAVKHAAVSFYYGSKRVGGRVFRGRKLPEGKWVAVTASIKARALPKGPQRLTVQAAHNYVGNAECHDNVQFEVRRILVCVNTKHALFQTSGAPQPAGADGTADGAAFS